LERGGSQENGAGPAVAAKLARLSERERQVLEGLVAGHPNKTIAYDLGISPRTVEVYRANLMTKMQAKSLSELIRMTILAEIPPAGRASE
jgi:two-component system response regulator FixJ